MGILQGKQGIHFIYYRYSVSVNLEYVEVHNMYIFGVNI